MMWEDKFSRKKRNEMFSILTLYAIEMLHKLILNYPKSADVEYLKSKASRFDKWEEEIRIQDPERT